MKSLRIQNGDLVLGPGGFATVTGPDRVRQDLGIAMREPVGADRFHPQWGSLLGEYVGHPIGDRTTMIVRSEVNRVIQNYVYVQSENIKRDVVGGNKARFEAGEVIRDVRGIDVRQDHTRLFVKVSLVTLSNDQVTIVQSTRT